MGYGRVSSVYAHRFIWELFNGPIPDGMCVCHHCDNPPCVNPSHLFLGSHIDNMRDKDTKDRSNNAAKSRPGEFHGSSKLTNEDVLEIRRRYTGRGKGHRANGMELAKEFGVTYGLIWQITARKIWTHI